jgi:hypothetical protein
MSLEQLPAKMARLSTNGNWGGPSMVDLPELPASAEAQDAAPSKHLKCIELEPGQCKYPSARSPFTFCGHPATGSYCAPHARLCGRAEMKRKERWQTHVYLTEDKFLELKRIAEQESRSTTGQIEYFLNRSIEAYANEKGVAKC